MNDLRQPIKTVHYLTYIENNEWSVILHEI